MPRIVLTNAYISVGGVDLSSLVASVTLNSTYDVVETTAFSSTAAKTRVAGLADNSVTLEFHQDFATSQVEQTIYPLLGQASTVIVKPPAHSIQVIHALLLLQNGLRSTDPSVNWPQLL